MALLGNLSMLNKTHTAKQMRGKGMRNKQGKMVCLAGFILAGLSMTATADVVGLWQMEGTSGESVGTVLNSINTGVLAAQGYVTVYSNQVVGASVYDPISDSTYANTSSVTLNGANSRVVVSDDGSLDVANFTVEAFVKLSPGDSVGRTLIQHYKGGAEPLGWSMSIAPDGNFRVRFDNTTKQNQGLNTGVAIDDDEWHHIALSFDGTTQQIVCYVDYESSFSNTLTGSSAEVSAVNANLLIGAFQNYSGTTNLIDEVRYSNEVLTSDQFLQTVPEPASIGLFLFGCGGMLIWRRRCSW
jgi:hypothetical protein